MQYILLILARHSNPNNIFTALSTSTSSDSSGSKWGTAAIVAGAAAAVGIGALIVKNY